VTCSWCEERFERFLDDDLPAPERAGVLAHVERCADCAALFAELRVVDALLLQPSAIEPGPDFTAATMADIRALPPPSLPPSRLPAYLVCYLVGAWCLVAAGFVLARHRMLDASLTLRDVARTVVVAIAGIFHVVLHVGDRGDAGAWPTLAGGVVIAYAMLLLSLLAARRYAVPWFAQRYRS
jgi:anti-sigma factor RsiW